MGKIRPRLCKQLEEEKGDADVQISEKKMEDRKAVESNQPTQISFLCVCKTEQYVIDKHLHRRFKGQNSRNK